MIRPLAILTAVMLSSIQVLLSGEHPAPTDDPPGKKGSAITVSKETTRITEPLTEDGYVDYVAALDAQTSKGVTPENNAAALLWKAVGPSTIEPEHRARYFGMLGILAVLSKKSNAA